MGEHNHSIRKLLKGGKVHKYDSESVYPKLSYNSKLKCICDMLAFMLLFNLPKGQIVLTSGISYGSRCTYHADLGNHLACTVKTSAAHH